MTGTLGRRLLLASGLLTLLVVLIFGAVLAVVGELNTSSRQGRHTRQVISAADAIEVLVLNLETSARGYVITQQEPFLAPWKRNLADFPGRAATLERLVSTSPQGFVIYLMRAVVRPAARRTASLERSNSILVQESGVLRADRATLEQQLDLDRALFDASSDGIRLVDLEGRTLLANSVSARLAREVFKIPADATLAQFTSVAPPTSDAAGYVATLHAIAADPENATDDVFELADVGRTFRRHTGPVRDADGGLIGST